MSPMSANPATMDIYENIAQLSAQMATAAQDNDWDLLVELENQVARLRDRLLFSEEEALTLEQATRKQLLIRRILDDDAEVRRHTEPWMEQVRRFLGAGTMERRVENAYGSMR